MDIQKLVRIDNSLNCRMDIAKEGQGPQQILTVFYEEEADYNDMLDYPEQFGMEYEHWLDFKVEFKSQIAIPS